MTFADAVRRLATDPYRLVAVRAAWNPPLHQYVLSLLSGGQLVVKRSDGQGMQSYQASYLDVTSADWDVYDLIAELEHAGRPMPPPQPPPSIPPASVGGNVVGRRPSTEGEMGR